MKFKNKYGTVNVLMHKKLFNNKTIALSMSGGADSTMLCILIAKTIEAKKLNSSIQPLNGYDIWAPLDSAGLPDIIKRIQTMFPTVKIHWPVSVVFKTNGSKTEDKNSYIGPFVEKLLQQKFINVFIPGISTGPPLEAQKEFHISDDAEYQIQRLPGYRLWNEVEKVKSALAPFKNVDKRFMIQCYKDFGLRNLLDMTQSCTNPKGNCGKCWWCNERNWAINEVFKEH